MNLKSYDSTTLRNLTSLVAAARAEALSSAMCNGDRSAFDAFKQIRNGDLVMEASTQYYPEWDKTRFGRLLYSMDRPILGKTYYVSVLGAECKHQWSNAEIIRVPKELAATIGVFSMRIEDVSDPELVRAWCVLEKRTDSLIGWVYAQSEKQLGQWKHVFRHRVPGDMTSIPKFKRILASAQWAAGQP